jgi:hypothetical protein
MENINKKYRIVCEMSNFPNLSIYIVYNIEKFSNLYNMNDNKVIELVNTSFLEGQFYSIPYLTQLIAEIEDCMNGESEIGAGWGNEMASVGTGKEMTKVWSNLSDNTQGEIPTSEILQLLKDWKVFLEEFYARAWGIPLDWVKEDYLEEAKKMQNP